MRCSDRFGGYGIVGFAVVDTRGPRLLDLMFSCRIQGKRVEHAFLAYILERFSWPERRDFFANFRKTERNARQGKVFEEMGFEVMSEQGGVLSLGFRKERAIPQERIVRIVEAAGAGH
jgi:predicted enzyme involved in methoxymalonyl-ACP biosynthesis